MENRNRAHPDNKCPADLLQPPWDTKAMAYWLPRFACETRNKSGGCYPATTIVSLLSGLQRRVRDKNPKFREMHTDWSMMSSYKFVIRWRACGLLQLHTRGFVLIDHSGYTLVPYQNSHSCTTSRPRTAIV